MRIEPQALKSLAYRWVGMEMDSYRDTVGHAGAEVQIEYLAETMEYDWQKPEPRAIYENDGSWTRHGSLDAGGRIGANGAVLGLAVSNDKFSRPVADENRRLVTVALTRRNRSFGVGPVTVIR